LKFSLYDQYCSIFFANCIESRRLIKCLYKVIKCQNVLTATETRFLPNVPTRNRPPDSSLPPNADSATPHHRRHHSPVYTSRYQSPLLEISFNFFCIVSTAHTYSQT
jgi:hypothetical protein